ncbi:ATP-dependent protease ATPase subunit HslU [bacterium]|nr:ATP-dependent protease ATPase subunit HslU [candidate division CSSED10-310 bacterium]
MTNILEPNEPFTGDLLTPPQTVEYLDRFIIGQQKAKRAVAIALRNRWRRQQLPSDIAEEILPKNILIIGPTGVGKTEISRRIARLTRSPFIKVEASKFTEVGYVGRDVESMIRDLTELGVSLVKGEHKRRVHDQAAAIAEERLLDLLLPPPQPMRDTLLHLDEDGGSGDDLESIADTVNTAPDAVRDARASYNRTREKLRILLRNGKLNDRNVEMSVHEKHGGLIEVFSSSGVEEIGMQIKEMMPGLFNQQKKQKKMAVPHAQRVLTDEEEAKLVDMDRVIFDAIQRVEQNGIVFIDELDKVAGREAGSGPDVSREGVQRDILPIIEGSTVMTKYGLVRTNHILFIAAGAFSVSKPADLIPELQGRFPVKVDVHSLSRTELKRILVEPENSIVSQYRHLLGTEGVTLDFHDDALTTISELAEQANTSCEDIGARRLHTIMEALLDDISFHASDMGRKTIPITVDYVRERVSIDMIAKTENIRKKGKVGF